MAKKVKAKVSEQPPVLLVSLAEADRRIRERIELGKPIWTRAINNYTALDEALAEYQKWHDYNRDYLRKIFSNSAISDEYVRWVGGVIAMNQSFIECVESYRQRVKEKIDRLESIHGRLALYEGGMCDPSSGAVRTNPKYSRRVFVVHGHDNALKIEVARFLERLSFEAVILHERANRGRTIIEKFEEYSDVGFAIALLTPDDVGAEKPSTGASPELVARARQNVIFELGFFIGKLSRERVVALHKPTTEILTDVGGVLYTPVDSHGAWKTELAKELKAAGYDVDFSQIV